MAKLMLSDALRDVSGPLGEFCRKLSGPDGASVWLPAFNRFLRRENPWDGKPFFPSWKTVMVGDFDSATALIEEVERQGMKVAEQIKLLARTGQFPIAEERKEVYLIAPTLKELGLSGTTSGAYHLHLPKVGLMPCTLEMLLLARLEYVEQPPEDELHVITNIYEIDDKKLQFTLDNDYVPREYPGRCVAHDEIEGHGIWADFVPFVCALPYD